MSDSPHPLPIGAELPDGSGEPKVYQVLEHIADGGMASVYLVKVKGRADGPFALKMNRRFDRTPTFYREAWWQRPGLRGVVPCYWSDHTTIDGQSIAIYIMPFLHEGNLLNKLHTKTYTQRDAVSWIHGISEALETMKCIHRDLKPENILIMGGSPLITDFGLAVSADIAERERWGEEVNRSGTPHYMSPEQHLVERLKELDVRSDLYTLTLMLHELWHGTLPYSIDQDPETLGPMKVSGEVKPKCTGIAEVDAFLTKGLTSKRALRFQTHAEFRQALLTLDAVLSTMTRPTI